MRCDCGHTFEPEIHSHKIMCGDATDQAQVDKLFGESKAAITFTSPPYNAGKYLGSLAVTKKHPSKNTHYKNNDDAMTDGQYLKFLESITKICLGKSEYFFNVIQQLAGNKIVFIDYLHLFKNNFVDMRIWDKGSGPPQIAHEVMTSEFEFIVIFSENQNPSRRINTAKFHGTLGNIYRGSNASNNEFSDAHNATFPLHLPTHHILHFTKKNNIVFDPFLGVGTTLIAAEQLDRVCMACEIDPGYVDIAIQRWENLTGKKAVKA